MQGRINELGEYSDCYTFKFTSWALLFPQLYIFDKACVIQDKTKIFVTALIRTLLYWVVYNILSIYLASTFYKWLFLGPIMVMIIINLIVLTIILTKTPLYKSRFDEMVERDTPTIVYTSRAEGILNSMTPTIDVISTAPTLVPGTKN